MLTKKSNNLMNMTSNIQSKICLPAPVINMVSRQAKGKKAKEEYQQ